MKEEELKEKVAIVTTIAERNQSEISKSEARLTSAIHNVKTELNNKIDKLDDKLNARMDKLDARIDKLDDKLNARMDKLDARVDKLDDKLDKLPRKMYIWMLITIMILNVSKFIFGSVEQDIKKIFNEYLKSIITAEQLVKETK